MPCNVQKAIKPYVQQGSFHQSSVTGTRCIGIITKLINFKVTNNVIVTWSLDGEKVRITPYHEGQYLPNSENNQTLTSCQNWDNFNRHKQLYLSRRFKFGELIEQKLFMRRYQTWDSFSTNFRCHILILKDFSRYSPKLEDRELLNIYHIWHQFWRCW